MRHEAREQIVNTHVKLNFLEKVLVLLMEISALSSEPHPRENKGAVVGVPQEQTAVARTISRTWVP